MQPSDRVFLVDDDAAIRRSVARALSKRGYLVDVFESAEAFLDAFAPDWDGCVVMDLQMPGMSGLELQARITAADAALEVIFITGHGSIEESVAAMKGGAVDFLVKPFRQEVLVERIGEALARSRARAGALAEQRELRARFERLTERELEITRLMVSDPSQTSSKHIARHFDISHRTADHHRARILEKTGTTSVAELISAAVRCNLLDR